MSEGTEDEGGVGPEVVVHRADPRVVHVVVDTGRGPVHDGVDAEVVDGLPSVSVQLGNVLPHIASQHSIVPIVIQQLAMQWLASHCHYVRTRVKSPVEAAHRDSPGQAGS